MKALNRKKDPQIARDNLQIFYVTKTIRGHQRRLMPSKYSCNLYIHKVQQAFQRLGSHLFVKHKR